MRVVIAGGGTGGHTSPALAIVEELRARDPQLDLRWIGRRGSIEERVSETAAVPFRRVHVRGWPRAGLFGRIRAAGLLAIATTRCALYLIRYRPHVVIGVGGFVSLPTMLAAQYLGFRTVIHEQNKRLGLANRLAAKKAKLFLASYPDTQGAYPRDRERVTGNPVRRGFLQPPTREEARQGLELSEGERVVLVVGGSQGAASLNGAVGEMLPHLGENELRLMWMTGNSAAASAREKAEAAACPVTVYPFIDDMVAAMAASDLIVTRAGASSTAELACVGRAGIFVPFPHATDDHQTENARAFVEAGAALLLEDSQCTGQQLLTLVRDLLNDDARLDAMEEAARGLARPGAAETIVDLLLELVYGKPGE